MRRRELFLFAAAVALHGQDKSKSTVRGRLVQGEAQPAVITTNGRRVILEGDKQTVAVLGDPRLSKEDFEAVGEWAGDDRFRIDPIHLRAMFVYRNGKRLTITYWCEVCAIRAYAPGRCVCCQEETALDVRDPALKDTDQ